MSQIFLFKQLKGNIELEQVIQYQGSLLPSKYL